MEPVWTYLSAGFVLGLSSALSPGPLMTLLISETLSRGRRAGVQVAIVPLLTDLPIILLSLAVLAHLEPVRSALGVVSLVGAGTLAWLAYQNLRARIPAESASLPGSGPLRRGLLVNILNPNAYLFWFTVGGPLVLGAWARGGWPTAAFFTSFYLLLVGFNLALVLAAARGRSFLAGRWTPWVLRALGVALLGFAVLFARQGLVALGFV